MHPFQVTMIVSSTSLILITALLFIIRTMPSRKGVGWWTSAAMLQSFAYLLQMLFHNEAQTVSSVLIFYLLQTTVNHLLIVGALIFIRHEPNLRLWLAIPVFMLACSTFLSLTGQSFLAVLVFATENALAFLILAHAIYESRHVANQSTKALGIFSILVGIHWLDYPLLGHLEWFATIGFIIGMTLAVGIFMSLAAMALLQFREHTKQSEARAIYTAEHDPLTGLYNRSSLDNLYEHYVAESVKNDRTFIALYLDLDGFKAVNDQYGHKSGDLILVTVAKRLEKWLGDKGDAVRIGGDEIIVLCRLRGVYSQQSAYKSARLLLDMIELPIVDGKNIHKISSSIGGCGYQPGVMTPTLDEMIQCADNHMYMSKHVGGHCIFIKEPNHLEIDTEEPIELAEPVVATKLKAIQQKTSPLGMT